MANEQLHARQKFAGNGADAEAEEVLDLRGGNQDGDAVGESDDHQARDEADRGAEAGESHGKQDDAGHQRDHGQAAHAEAGHNAGDDDDESAGGSADLGARAAQSGDEEAGDDGGVEAGLRRDAGGDAEGHGQRQRDQPDGDAGEQVVQEHLRACSCEEPEPTWADSDC